MNKTLELDRMDQEVLYNALSMYIGHASDQLSDPELQVDSPANLKVRKELNLTLGHASEIRQRLLEL